MSSKLAFVASILVALLIGTSVSFAQATKGKDAANAPANPVLSESLMKDFKAGKEVTLLPGTPEEATRKFKLDKVNAQRCELYCDTFTVCGPNHTNCHPERICYKRCI